jgi:hypothetical protein
VRGTTPCRVKVNHTNESIFVPRVATAHFPGDVSKAHSLRTPTASQRSLESCQMSGHALLLWLGQSIVVASPNVALSPGARTIILGTAAKSRMSNTADFSNFLIDSLERWRPVDLGFSEVF